MKLILRSGGKIENRYPFKRSPSGFRVRAASDASLTRLRAREIMILGAVAKSFSRSVRMIRTTDVD